MPPILVIDNYDSFTYNLVQYLGMCGSEVEVRRNDQISLDEIASMAPAGILMSPGPCTPNESGICLGIVDAALKSLPGFTVPLFGVCLGHQAIGQVIGATVEVAGRIMHGKASMIEHDGLGLFAGIPNPVSVIRYHSLIVTRDTIPEAFCVTATSKDDDYVMGMRHRTLPIEGVQFHPESVKTDHGLAMVQNFVNMTNLGV